MFKFKFVSFVVILTFLAMSKAYSNSDDKDHSAVIDDDYNKVSPEYVLYYWQEMLPSI